MTSNSEYRMKLACLGEIRGMPYKEQQKAAMMGGELWKLWQSLQRVVEAPGREAGLRPCPCSGGTAKTPGRWAWEEEERP